MQYQNSALEQKECSVLLFGTVPFSIFLHYFVYHLTHSSPGARQQKSRSRGEKPEPCDLIFPICSHIGTKQPITLFVK